MLVFKMASIGFNTIVNPFYKINNYNMQHAGIDRSNHLSNLVLQFIDIKWFWLVHFFSYEPTKKKN